MNSCVRSDIFFSCSTIILPRGILPGAIVQFDNMFFAVSTRGNWYFAETKMSSVAVISMSGIRSSKETKKQIDVGRLLKCSVTLPHSRCLADMPVTLISAFYAPLRPLISMHKICGTVRKIHFLKIYRHGKAVIWEATAYLEDGSGSALVKFDGRRCIELLQLDQSMRVQLEALCRSTPMALEYSPMRISIEDAVNISGDNDSKINPNEFLLRAVRSSFVPRSLICFCRSISSRAELKPTAAVVRVNELTCDSLRIPCPMLKCYRMERIGFFHESYANLNVLDKLF